MLSEKKREYNALLARWKKAGTIETILKENQLPELQKICKRLGELLGEIENYTEVEALFGFLEVS